MSAVANNEPGPSPRPDPFARPLAAIDHDLHEQVQRRENGVNEILHGCHTAERADLAIARLIEERLRATARDKVNADS